MRSTDFFRIVSLAAFILLLTGCSYRFNPGSTGAARSLSVENFENLAAGGPANLSQIFTERLKEYYQQNSDLAIVTSGGDWQIAGAIARYNVVPVAPQGNEMAGANQLEITVEVNFVNTLYNEETKATELPSFTQAFSFYAPFEPNQNLLDVEDELIDIIFDQIVFDIYTRTTSNW